MTLDSAITLKYKTSKLNGNYFLYRIEVRVGSSNLEFKDAQITVNFGHLRSYVYCIMFAGQAATKL